MSWGSVIGGLANLGGSALSAYGSYQASKQAGQMYGASEELTEAQIALLEMMMAQSGEQWNYWKKYELPIQRQLSKDYLSTYLPLQKRIAQDYGDLQLPLERQIIQEAQEGIDPRYEAVTGQASADVAQGFGRTRAATNRELARMGVNPNSAKFMDVNRQQDLGQSVADASARTLSREGERRRVEDTNWSRRVQAAGIKRGLAMPAPSGGFANSAMGLQGQALAGLSGAANQYMNLGNLASNMGSQSAYGMGGFLNQLGGSGSGSLQGLWGDISGLFKEQGGPVEAGQPYIVGENGPEWHVPAEDGVILPNPQTMRQMRQMRQSQGYGEDENEGAIDVDYQVIDNENAPMDMIKATEIARILHELLELVGGNDGAAGKGGLSTMEGRIVLRESDGGGRMPGNSGMPVASGGMMPGREGMGGGGQGGGLMMPMPMPMSGSQQMQPRQIAALY